MKIREMFQKGERTISFEFFPPKNEEGERNLFEAIEQLKVLRPSFVSVTYGAMGTTRAKTFELTCKIKFEMGLESMAHLTCVAHRREEILDILDELKRKGIENILALRGDPPEGVAKFVRPEGGFGYARELVEFIRRHNGFSIGVAGSPEGHVECPSKELDLKHLKQKVDAGADFVITQLFFDNRDFFDFLERARRIGIRVPVIPGIMPVSNVKQIEKFTQMCGAKIPSQMRSDLGKIGRDSKAVEAYGVDYATRQCEELWRSGVQGLHFYTLNRSTATRQIYKNLGLVRN